MKTRFTDNHLATFYLYLFKDYNKNLKGKKSDQIYIELLNKVKTELKKPEFKDLPEDEKLKAYKVLHAFVNALPEYRKTPEAERPIFYFDLNITIYEKYPYRPAYFYYGTPDPFYDLLLFSALANTGCHHGGLDNHHGHGDHNLSQEAMMALIVIALAAIVAIVTLVAIYYLLVAGFDALERLWFNEGGLQAIISIGSAIASGFAASFLTTTFLSSPIAALALAAGFSNPAGLVIFGVICLTIIGAALGCFVVNKIQESIIEKSNKDAMEPKDPYRFSLTKSEEQRLEFSRDETKDSLDPIKVKCAIMALRKELNSKHLSYFLHRFSSSNKENEILTTIRKIRRGELTEVTVGEGENTLIFDLKKSPELRVVSRPVVPIPKEVVEQHHHGEYDPTHPPRAVIEQGHHHSTPKTVIEHHGVQAPAVYTHDAGASYPPPAQVAPYPYGYVPYYGHPAAGPAGMPSSVPTGTQGMIYDAQGRAYAVPAGSGELYPTVGQGQAHPSAPPADQGRSSVLQYPGGFYYQPGYPLPPPATGPSGTPSYPQ